MHELLMAIFSALWLGILTSISPCPLTTNIAAVSYIGKRIKKPGIVLAAGLLYTAGRATAYLALGIIIVTSLLSIPSLSRFLQNYTNKILGPVLIISGLFLLEAFSFSFFNPGSRINLQNRADKSGISGAFILGVLFAVSFCPVSAALFFGSLIPLAVKIDSGLLIPAFYGIGTAIPVVIFSVLIAVGARSIGVLFNKITQIEKWIRRITGLIFIGVGFYFMLEYF